MNKLTLCPVYFLKIKLSYHLANNSVKNCSFRHLNPIAIDKEETFFSWGSGKAWEEDVFEKHLSIRILRFL